MHTLLEQGVLRKLVTIILASFGLLLFAMALTEFKEFRYVGADIAPVRTIAITGEAERFVIPDAAQFNFSIIEEAKTFAEAQDAATKKVNEAIAYLEDAGVSRSDIKTTNYSINPRYEYRSEAVSFCTSSYCPPSTGSRNLVGYEVNQTIQVKTKKLDEVGELVSGIGERGASTVSSVSFTVEDKDSILEDIRDEAIADSRSEAKRVARALGTSLGRVVSYNSQGYSPYARAELSYAAYDDSAEISSPDIPAGENRLSATVVVTYELR
ncbi:MAG: SIMPL domain-containing protein [bacterium]|nr:SIMPL domain-containing protein [bacterium]